MGIERIANILDTCVSIIGIILCLIGTLHIVIALKNDNDKMEKLAQTIAIVGCLLSLSNIVTDYVMSMPIILCIFNFVRVTLAFVGFGLMNKLFSMKYNNNNDNENIENNDLEKDNTENE